jgi:hypothetical protein
MENSMTEEELKEYILVINIPLTFCVVFIGKYFSEMWEDKETVLAYKWGMDNYDLEIENSNLDKGVVYNHFLDLKIPLRDEQEAFYRKCVVWLRCIGAFSLVIFCNLAIFFVQYWTAGRIVHKFNVGEASVFETIIVYFILIGSPYVFLYIRDFFSAKFFEHLR